LAFQRRSFSDASLTGNPVGRPRTSSAVEPSRAAKALIAAKRYRTHMDTRGTPRDVGAARSINSGAEVSYLRGARNQEIRDIFDEGST
jgi:hypothetical protein